MKKIINIILVSSFFLTCQSTKNSYSIWGRIVDHQFSPITDFSIKIIEYDKIEGHKKLTQNFDVNHVNGEFLIKNLDPHTYHIEIIVKNYTRYSIIKEITQKKESVGEIVLQNTW